MLVNLFHLVQFIYLFEVLHHLVQESPLLLLNSFKALMTNIVMTEQNNTTALDQQ